MYVTEICKRSQRRKQNCDAILRLRDFLDGLPPTEKLRRRFCFAAEKSRKKNPYFLHKISFSP